MANTNINIRMDADLKRQFARDLRLRRPLLYPAELQAHTVYPAR